MNKDHHHDIQDILKELPMDRAIPGQTYQKIVSTLENIDIDKNDSKIKLPKWRFSNLRIWVAVALCIFICIPIIVSFISHNGFNNAAVENQALLKKMEDILSDAHYTKNDYKVVHYEVRGDDGIVIVLDKLNLKTTGEVYALNHFKKKGGKWNWDGSTICSEGWSNSSNVWCGILKGSDYSQVLIGKNLVNPVTKTKILRINDHMILWYYLSQNPNDLSIKAIKKDGTEIWVKTLSNHQVPNGEPYYFELK